MSLSMYDASAPCFLKMLHSMSAILNKAHDYATSRKIEPATLLQSRLYPDMFPLVRQVQIATDHAKGAIARLAGVEVPKYEDNEQSFEELGARIARTIAFVESFTPAQINGSEERPIELKVAGHELSFKGLEYLIGFALPNFYFHIVTAYNILRHNGLDIGKRDYMGG